MKFLTRQDANVGAGTFDSIKWALETHCEMPDNAVLNTAVLRGNEDAPTKIEFFSQKEPSIDDLPIYTWEAPADDAVDVFDNVIDPVLESIDEFWAD